jgi:hypothetical protein
MQLINTQNFSSPKRRADFTFNIYSSVPRKAITSSMLFPLFSIASINSFFLAEFFLDLRASSSFLELSTCVLIALS